jgi:hypothetical protein
LQIGKLTVNVLLLVGLDGADGKLAVGRLCSAVTAGKIVDDKGSNLVASNVLESRFNRRDLGTGVTSIRISPDSSRNPSICKETYSQR